MTSAYVLVPLVPNSPGSNTDGPGQIPEHAVVMLQERNFPWPVDRTASQGTPEFFQETKKDIARFQFFLSYFSESFIMGIFPLLQREILPLPSKASALLTTLKNNLEQSQSVLLLTRHAEMQDVNGELSPRPVLMALEAFIAVTQLNNGASGIFTSPVLQHYFQHWPRLHCL